MSQIDTSEQLVIEPDTAAVPPVTKRKHIGANAFIGTFGTTIFIQACTVVQGIIVARSLGPTGRGQLAAIILWPTVISMVGLVGCNRVVTRQIGRGYDIGSTIRSALNLTLIFSLLGVSVGFFAISYLIPEGFLPVVWLAQMYLVFVPLNQITKVLEAVDQGRGDFKRFNLLRAIINPIIIVGLISLAFLGSITLQGVVLAYTIAYLIICVTRVFLVRKHLSYFPTWKTSISMLREGIPFGVVSVVNELYIRVDIILVLWLLEPRDLGFYSVAMSASMVLNSISQSAGMVAFAKSAQVVDLDRFKDIAKAFRVCTWLKILGGITLATLFPILIPLVYGKAFSPAITIATILVFSNILYGLGNLLDECLQGYGHPKKSVVGRLLSMLTLSILGLPLVHSVGLTGLAWSYLAAKAVYLIWNLLCLVRVVKQANFGELIRPQISDLYFLARKFKALFRKAST